MRFLKNKIAKAFNHLPKEEPPPSDLTKEESGSEQKGSIHSNKRRRLPGVSFTPEKVKITKNIVINYGRAISTFATSKLADPYLKPLLLEHQVQKKDFQGYVKSMKDNIGGISSFRQMLVTLEEDSKDVLAYKKTFAALAEIFIKYFSVNWITHGRMGHKDVYLKYRFKMLRRIKDPEKFTYLKGT